MTRRSRKSTARAVSALLTAGCTLLAAGSAFAQMELRSVGLPDGARLSLRLDACATAGPLMQVREADGAVRISLTAADLELPCADSHSVLPSAVAPGVGSWVRDWWVDEPRDAFVLVSRATGAPHAHSLQTGERVPLDPETVVARLHDATLWPREQLRALDLAAAWLPIEELPALRRVARDAGRPPVVRLRAAALLQAFGDGAGRALILQWAEPRPKVSGLRARADLTDADLGELQTRAGSTMRCDRPPPWAQEQPDDAEAARQYAIQLLPAILNLQSVRPLRALVRTSDPLDRLAVRTALLCLAWRQAPDDPRAEQLERAARWTGGGAGLRTDGPSLREIEASASSPDPYVAGIAIRQLLEQDGGTRSSMLRLLRRGTAQDRLVALYFATHPDPEAVDPLVEALARHDAKSRTAELIALALRASVPETDRDALIARNGVSPARWQEWGAQRKPTRSNSLHPLSLGAALLPLVALLWTAGAFPRRRRT